MLRVLSHFSVFPRTEFLGSLFSNLVAQGAVISCGVLTYQMNYDELTPGRILCISFATAFVRFLSFLFVLVLALALAL